jgi:hypothetical protein
MIQFRCACGKLLQAREEHAGLAVNCPGCGSVQTVPGVPEAVRAAPPVVQAVPAPPSEQTTARPYPAPAAPPPRPRRREPAPPRGLSGKALTAIIGGVVAAGLVVALGIYLLVRANKDREGRRDTQDNLKQLGLAMHHHQDVYKRLPADAIYSKDGRPLLSWRVAILPFIEQKNLYDQFRLDEPWDSPHNKQLLQVVPKIYAPVRGEAPPGHTHYQVFTGPRTPFKPNIPPRFPASFPDGTSNTFLIVETDEAVPWTKPADVRVEPNGPLPPLGGLWGDGFYVVMGDGSVRFVDRRRVSDRTLHLLIDPADGQVLPEDWDLP